MTINYNATDKTLTISSPEPIYYYTFRQIMFGDTSRKELNLCSPNSYTYKLKGGVLPRLRYSYVNFTASHNGGSLPDINVTMNIIDSNVVNIKWNYVNRPFGWFKPFEVPE